MLIILIRIQALLKDATYFFGVLLAAALVLGADDQLQAVWAWAILAMAILRGLLLLPAAVLTLALERQQ